MQVRQHQKQKKKHVEKHLNHLSSKGKSFSSEFISLSTTTVLSSGSPPPCQASVSISIKWKQREWPRPFAETKDTQGASDPAPAPPLPPSSTVSGRNVTECFKIRKNSQGPCCASVLKRPPRLAKQRSYLCTWGNWDSERPRALSTATQWVRDSVDRKTARAWEESMSAEHGAKSWGIGEQDLMCALGTSPWESHLLPRLGIGCTGYFEFSHTWHEQQESGETRVIGCVGNREAWGGGQGKGCGWWRSAERGQEGRAQKAWGWGACWREGLWGAQMRAWEMGGRVKLGEIRGLSRAASTPRSPWAGSPRQGLGSGLGRWCFWTVVLEKTLESPLDCKEIQPVHPKNESWVFIGRTDVEAETPIL